jgi:hypothetical protein
MLSDDDVARIEQAARDATLGFNTQDLPRRYGKDIKALLDDRRELKKQLADALQPKAAPAVAEPVAASNAIEEVDG